MVQEQEVVSGRSDDDEVDEEIDDLYRTNKKWARISFTGKLGKNTALLVHRDLGFKAIDLILKYREKAGVNPLNRFIFGEPLLENFSTSKREHKSESNTDKNSNLSCSETSDEDYSPSVTEAEMNYIFGKKQSPRVSWSAVEKATAREYFHDEIYFGDRITREKINKFFQEEKRVYSKRTPHLIMQWVKGQRKDIINKKEGRQGKRNRWSTPEKEVLRSSTEKHSAGGTIPTLSECENIFEQNEGVLQGRNPKSIKAYIHRQLRCDNPQFNNNKV
ncbi:hypothetical protein HHI36_000294 [Cryptolaemus montrouzieri]|uniref:Uncharacterized protein n=1 Tax=Cryptolaemus montrouzieri TaxID=559131 RepID=A0ABD2P5B7_9CUCU